MFNMEMVELNHERCVIEMTVTEEMTNGAGVCQGGVVFILADTAMAMSASSRRDGTCDKRVDRVGEVGLPGRSPHRYRHLGGKASARVSLMLSSPIKMALRSPTL